MKRESEGESESGRARERRNLRRHKETKRARGERQNNTKKGDTKRKTKRGFFVVMKSERVIVVGVVHGVLIHLFCS
jgi:hypothetical protein